MQVPAKITLLDGGMGHLLRRFGVPIVGEVGSQERFLGVCLANTEQPELVKRAHRDYLEAGSEVITTNTYSCVPNCVKLRTACNSQLLKSPPSVSSDGGSEELGEALAVMNITDSMSTTCSEEFDEPKEFSSECNCNGWKPKFQPPSREENDRGEFDFLSQCIDCASTQAQSARTAFLQKRANNATSTDEPLIAACIPPLGPSYQAFEAPSDEVMRHDYDYISREIAPHCNLFLCETMSSSREAVAAAEVVRNQVTNAKAKPIWISFTLGESEDGKVRLPSGELLEDACEAIFDVFSCSIDDEPRNFLDAILINCCAPGLVLKAMPVLRGAIASQEELGDSVRFGGYPNAFVNMADCYDKALTPERFADLAKEMIDQGATIIGGCCGIFPEHIRAVATMLGKEPTIGTEIAA